ARGGHLDDRGLPVAERPPLRLDLAEQWIAHARAAERAVRRTDERVDGALASIGEGQLVEPRVGPCAAEAARDGGRDCDRIGAPLERLRRDDDPVRNVDERKRVDGAWPATEIESTGEPRFARDRRRLYRARTGRPGRGLVRAR